MNIFLTFNHTAYVKGDHTNFKIESSFGVEASVLYPNVKYITVDEYLNKLILDANLIYVILLVKLNCLYKINNIISFIFVLCYYNFIIFVVMC